MNLKKMLAGFMTLCMLVTAMPVIAYAEEPAALPKVSVLQNVNVLKEDVLVDGAGWQDEVMVTYYMEFATLETEESEYDDWIMDFAIKFSKDVTAEAGTYLYGELGTFKRAMPVEGMNVVANQEYRVMEGLATLTYEDIRTSLGEFPCGLILPESFLNANSDLIVTLDLNLYPPVGETGEIKRLGGGIFNAYTVTFDAKDGADAVQQIVPANGKYKVTEPVDPVREGYQFLGWYKDGAEYDFEAPVTADMTLYAKWEAKQPAQPEQSGGSSSPKYPVSVDKNDSDNGTVKLSSTKAKKGSTVTLTITPEPGYDLDKLAVLDKDGNEVELTDKGNGRFTFKMPRGGVDVEPSFVEINEEDVPLADLPFDKENVLVLTIGQLLYQLNDNYEVNDVAPVIKEGRTFLPIRLIAESLGATVGWNEAEQAVTIVKGDTTIVIYIGQAFARVNGEPVQLDTPAFIANDRTYLPVRFVAENMGATVSWDAGTNKVTIVG